MHTSHRDFRLECKRYHQGNASGVLATHSNLPSKRGESSLNRAEARSLRSLQTSGHTESNSSAQLDDASVPALVQKLDGATAPGLRCLPLLCLVRVTTSSFPATHGGDGVSVHGKLSGHFGLFVAVEQGLERIRGVLASDRKVRRCSTATTAFLCDFLCDFGVTGYVVPACSGLKRAPADTPGGRRLLVKVSRRGYETCS